MPTTSSFSPAVKSDIHLEITHAYIPHTFIPHKQKHPLSHPFSLLHNPHPLHQHLIFLSLSLSLSLSQTQPYVCFRVPKHMSKRHWIELTEVVQDCGKHHIFDRLMIPPNDSVALRVLSKFETQSDMIHVFYQPDEVFVLELPRYELSFEFDSNIGSFRSKNFNDFVLSGQQQLDDALFGFKQYLILESKSRKRM